MSKILGRIIVVVSWALMAAAVLAVYWRDATILVNDGWGHFVSTVSLSGMSDFLFVIVALLPGLALNYLGNWLINRRTDS